MQREDENTAETAARARNAPGASSRRMIASTVVVFAVLLFAAFAVITLLGIGPTGWPGRTSVLCCDTPGQDTP